MTAVLVFSRADVERLLPMDACIDAMAAALVDLSAGRLDQPLRTMFAPRDAAGIMAWMPAHRAGDAPLFACKLLVVVPTNPARGLDRHQGAVALFDGTTGELRAIMDASPVTAIRTAAVSAVAARHLARADAAELAIVGTGVQAERHLAAIPLVRPIRRVRVAGRTPERARAFVDRIRPPAGVAVVAAASVEAAVRGADIVVTATTSATPVVELGWLAPGTHVSAVGASRPPAHELAPETVAACATFTDRRESLEGEAGEWRMGVARGLFGRDHLRAELGEVVAGARPGRASDAEITLFRSLGLAVEDLAAAELVWRRGGGTRAPW